MVNIKNEQEEKVLLAFLDSLNYNYQSNIKNEDLELNEPFLNLYNDELNKADQEIELGNYISQDEVEKLFIKKRKAR